MGFEIENALYVVATPIGNLGDITLRAIEVLKSVDVIACEDTRITARLCEKYEIKTRLVSYHKFSETSRCDLFLGYLKEGKSIAIVSDAGTPLISDPGEVLVQTVLNEGFRVIPIVGASAPLALLSAIARKREDFKFFGFLPRVKNQIAEIFIKNKNENLIFYESPNRVVATLQTLAQVRPNSMVAFGRELTKKFEEIKCGSVEEILEYFSENEPRGEFVVMAYADVQNDEQEAQIIEKASTLKKLKLSDKDIVNVLVSLFDFSKNKIKEILFKL